MQSLLLTIIILWVLPLCAREPPFARSLAHLASRPADWVDSHSDPDLDDLDWMMRSESAPIPHNLRGHCQAREPWLRSVGAGASTPGPSRRRRRTTRLQARGRDRSRHRRQHRRWHQQTLRAAPAADPTLPRGRPALRGTLGPRPLRASPREERASRPV